MEFKSEIPENLKPSKPKQVDTSTTAAMPGLGAKELIEKRNDQILIDDRGAFKTLTLEARYRLAKYALASGMVPKSYATPEQVMLGMEYALELGMPPLTGLRCIAVIKGTPSIFGDMPMALVRRSGLMDSCDEKVYTKDGAVMCLANGNISAEVYAASCTVVRKHTGGAAVERFFTMDDAKRAGLLGKDGPWHTYPRRMLQMRARSQALKDVFPDALSGIAITEYDFNAIPDEGGIMHLKPVGGESGAKKLGDILKGEK